MGKLLPSKLEEISSLIRTIRGQKVILDSDLARIFGVQTFRFNEAVKRNLERFPADFMFQLTREEHANLISQIAISSLHGGRRKLPYAFTENGAIMAANVLNSPEAVRMSVFVVRAFVQMREELQAHATVFKRLAEIDQKLVTHDVILRDVYEKLRPLLNPPAKPAKEMGFHTLLKKRDAEAAVHAEAQRG